MRSPFGIFRKHGTILTAALVVLCMFAFTLADFLRPEHLPALLGMTAFAALFYLLGQPSGKGGWFAAVGAVLGLMAMQFVPNFWKPAPAATTAVGELSDEELHEKVEQRQKANQFILNVYQVGMPPRPSLQDMMSRLPRELMSNQQIFQMVMQQTMQQQQAWDRGFQNFGFAPLEESLESARESAVREWVMAKQADEIGIRVSDKAVTEYLQKASNNRLTAEQFTELRKETGMSEADLYDVLRYHIKARQYLLLTFPSVMTPPEQQWEFYKRATVRQDMALAKIPVQAFVDQVADPSDADLSAFYDQYKTREPEGILTRDEGWIEPVEIMTPEPAFAIPRRIQLEYLTARVTPYEPTDAEVVEYFEQHKQGYPNPAFSRPFEPEDIPEPLTPNGPAVAQKPKREAHTPAWAEKEEFLTFHQAREEVRADLIYEKQQEAREANDKLISKALSRMNELSLNYQSQGNDHKEPTEIAAELKKFAEENGLEYTVTKALTAKQMTAQPIGKAMEVEINPTPLPGQPKVAVRPDGACVTYLAFRGSNPEERYRPTQVISPNELDTRSVFWKIEDLPRETPEWGDLSDEKRSDVERAWKMQEARDIANKRATELRDAVRDYLAKQPKDAEPKDLALILEELKEETVTGKEQGPKLVVTSSPNIQWMQPPSQSSPPRIGTVIGVSKAGEKFMEAAFHDFEKVDDVGVLVNADASEYYVGRLLDRQYGEGDSLESLREAFLNQAGTPALQTMSELIFQQNQELIQKWRQSFDEKYKIQVAQPQNGQQPG